MAEQAQVTSVEALASFRASLILFLSKARPALEEACTEVLRTRLWLQNDRRRHWESQVRLRTRELERAQQELLNARLSNLREATLAQEMAVQRMKRALQQAEAKLKRLKQWDREFENRTDPLTRQLGQLNTFLAIDMLQAAAYLAQAVQTLEAYVDLAPPSSSAAPALAGAPNRSDNAVNTREPAVASPPATGEENASKGGPSSAISGQTGGKD